VGVARRRILKPRVSERTDLSISSEKNFFFCFLLLVPRLIDEPIYNDRQGYYRVSAMGVDGMGWDGLDFV
jgi:hypothetical protein